VMQTEFAITPERQTPGSDLDTFYDPNHDVVTSGTSGDVMLRSLRFAQWSEGRVLGLPWRVGYVYRRSRKPLARRSGMKRRSLRCTKFRSRSRERGTYPRGGLFRGRRCRR
jgi:hypothetical protein